LRRLQNFPDPQDGNGRLSRVLTTLLLLQSGYRHVPYSTMPMLVLINYHKLPADLKYDAS